MVIEEILSPTAFVTEWTSLSKTSDFFFWLIFLVGSPASLITLFKTLIFLTDEDKFR